MADTGDLKSLAGHPAYGFESRPRHHPHASLFVKAPQQAAALHANSCPIPVSDTACTDGLHFPRFSTADKFIRTVILSPAGHCGALGQLALPVFYTFYMFYTAGFSLCAGA